MNNKLLSKNTNGRRKFLLGLTALVTGGFFFGYKALSKDTKTVSVENKRINTTGDVPKPNARLGINLSGIAYWTTEFPFVDLMHQSGPWVSQPPSGDWGKGPALIFDENGWVRKLEKQCRATKIICAGGSEAEYPSGTYVVLYDGEGEIALTLSAGVIKKMGEGRLEIKVDATKGMFAIDIISTNPQNHMRNIRVIAPGFESSYQSNPWHPHFLRRWSGIACIRLMDMMATNNSTQMHWQNRPKISDASYAEKGVPVELLVDLANRLDTDAWFCMPHQVDDSYIEQFATVVKLDLKPHLHAWVEYSNEVWNGGFDQYGYAAKQGQKLGLGDNEWEASFHYNAHRAVEIFNIWQAVFEGNQRIVKVIASQAANAYLSEQLLKADGLAGAADVLAIAPYVSFNISPTSNDAATSEEKVATWHLDQLFKYLNTVALPESESWMNENKKIADAFGVKLVAYEAGQHLVGIQGAENNDKLGSLLMQANADKRMGDVYTKNLAQWQAAGGDLMCTFSSVEGWSKWGSWGLLRHTKETAADSPKFKAVMDWAKSRGQKVSY